MAGEKINLDYITEYLHQILPQTKGYLLEMEQYAIRNEVPIIHKEVKSLLEVLCKLKKPEKILEIGTAIGYSAAVFANSTADDAKIITIERDTDIADIARNNFNILGIDSKVKLIEGEALDILPCLSNKYDIIFIDAAKGYYNEFFDIIINLVNNNGLIISDNVLYKGMTATDSLVKRRQKTIVGRMRDYLKMLCNHKNLTTSVIPIGDGVAISYFEKEKENEQT